ncbi:FAD-binding domain-containing protein [Penicillium longicatenatum]|uniref:FAD-binding domain-containing protein n=1 Tax=Penicillium longicatenatum TaxID=1561947 RepID=UPI002548D668|nr:FAD-binding domain-containing protein [Penicillium longicatenatum]KAJ5635607.1 FAD-binding domain-containing protein [Penicillium longicatenatum]
MVPWRFLVFLGLFAKTIQSQTNATRTACETLRRELPGAVYFPGSTGYTDTLASYFSREEQELEPSCVIKPTNSSEISTAIQTIHSFLDSGVQFAVRGGGHTPYAGAANIDKGITLDLSLMNEVKLSADRKTVELGPGGKWRKVWKALDPYNVTVTGGRDSDVGIGGYLLGGGLSYLGPILGWGCDNILEYEIVLASGKIITVNENLYPDLFLALKGGGNNFGIVTKYIMSTYPLGKFWGGFIAYETNQWSAQTLAFSKFMGAKPYDPHAAMIQSYGWSSAFGGSISNGLAYTKPVPYPAAFNGLANNATSFSDALRIDTMESFAAETDSYQSSNRRQTWYTTTFAHTPDIYSTIYKIYNASIAGITNVPAMNWYLTLQPSPVLNRVNSLGLDTGEERLGIALITAYYNDTFADRHVDLAARKLIMDIEAATKEAGVYRPYKYYNYAGAGQAVIDGYGNESKGNLQAVSKKYDPQGLFQKGLPGGFKIFN